MNPPLSVWKPAPDNPTARTDEVHIWRVDLDAPVTPALRSLLTDDEHARAERFVYRIHGDRFVAGRGALRRILGRYLGVAPDALRFGYGPQGKPRLTTPGPVCFNVSHSAGRALIAVTSGREVGIDIEKIDVARADEAIARRFFAPAEVADFLSLAADERVAGFFNAWTRKEAYMKATGQGLGLGLDRFRVTLRPGEPAALIETAWRPEDIHRWSMRAIDPGEGYAAAVVVEGEESACRLYGWPRGGGR